MKTYNGKPRPINSRTNARKQTASKTTSKKLQDDFGPAWSDKAAKGRVAKRNKRQETRRLNDEATK